MKFNSDRYHPHRYDSEAPKASANKLQGSGGRLTSPFEIPLYYAGNADWRGQGHALDQ